MRGGFRQHIRLAREAASARPRSRSRSPRVTPVGGVSLGRPSKLATSILRDWTWGTKGKLHAPQVQRYAADAVSDGCKHPLLARLARLGCHGHSPQNIHAQLLRMFRSNSKAEALIQNLDGSRVMCMIHPHAQFQFVFQQSLSKFRVRFGASKPAVRNFWEQFLGTRDGRAMQALHPHLAGKSPEDLATTIPMNLHNDGGPCSNRLSAYSLTWGSFLGLGSELESRYLIASWIKGFFEGLPELVWGELWWSFCLLATGLDEHGQPFALEADGTAWEGGFLFFLCDIEYFAVDIGLSGASHFNMCSWCRCTRDSTCPWNDLGSSARWRQRRTSNAEFLARVRPGHGMVEWPGFSIFTIRLDLLHVCDYKGVTGKIFGSTVWSVMCETLAIFQTVFPGCADTREARLVALDLSLRSWCKTHLIRNRLPKLCMRALFTSGTANDFPNLVGPGVKAANTRACVGWLRWLSTRFNNFGVLENHRFVVCSSIDDYYRVLYSGGIVLTEDEFERQFKLCLNCLRSYQFLAYASSLDGALNWHITPKFHFFAELSLQARLLNPRYQQCYASESMVGRVMNIYANSLHGPFAETIQRTVLTKYLLGLEIDLSGITDWA